MAASYLKHMITNNLRIDFDVLEFYSLVKRSGEKYFTLELAKLIMQPHPID